MSRDGFTLIEVMVAAILISVVGLSLLQMHHNSATMSEKMRSKFSRSDWVLISSFESKFEKTKKNINFRDLAKPFNIDKGAIRKGLNTRAQLQAELYERIDASEISKNIEEETDEVVPVLDVLRLEVYRQNLIMEEETYSVFRVFKP